MYKVSICGCGGIAEVHARILSEMTRAELISCCDPSVKAASVFEEKFGIRPFTSLREMLAAEKCDALHICSPHYTHVPLALYALDQRLHVVMEKPPAMSLAELETLKRKAGLSETSLGICFQNRFNNSSQLAYRLIKTGRLGAVKAARAFVTWNRGNEYYSESSWRGAANTEGGGLLINQAIHTIDLLIWLLGEPKSIIGSAKNYLHREVSGVEDTADMLLEYNGVNAMLYATLNNSSDDAPLIEIFGENMSLHISGSTIRIVYKDGFEETINDDENIPGKDYWGSGHRKLISSFYECLDNGEKFPIGLGDCSGAVRAISAVLGND